MKTRKTNSNDRETYRYTFKSPIGINGKKISGMTIKPGENGVTVADIKMLHAMDDSEVYYNNKNLRPARTNEEKAEIKAWKERYVQRFKARHGYEPNQEDVEHEAEEHFPSNYNLSLDYDADGELAVDKSRLAEKLSVTHDSGFEWSEKTEEALAMLTDKQRHVIKLMFVDGYLQSEIASMLGISSAGVKKHLDSAFARLRKALGKKF